MTFYRPPLSPAMGCSIRIPSSGLWQQHRSGTHNWENRLWIVLMFQAWRAHYV